MARIRTATVVLAVLTVAASPAVGQWVSFTDSTLSRMSYSAMSTDPEEKDFLVADMDNDGDLDLVNVRKDPFYGPVVKTHVLFMNVNGVLTDQTATYAPGFLSNPSSARTLVIADFDADTWPDVIVCNTDGQQPQYYKNMGNTGGTWVGLQLEAGRLPTFSPGPMICGAGTGDADNDGDIDVHLGDYGTLFNRLLINNGSGFFTDETASRFAGGVQPNGFSTESVFVDLNGDGARDIMYTQAGSMGAYLNKAGGIVGNFTALMFIPSAATYTSAVGDLNNDGKADLYAGQDGQDAYLINTTPNGAMTLSWSVTTFQSTSAAAPNYSPHTTFFAGNPYIVDVDGDGYNDIAMADTDVSAAGCDRRAVLTRNVFPSTGSTTQMLTTPWGATLQNFNTQGTHDVAVFDVDGDGYNDLVSGLCVGYKVFIQIPPAPVLTLSMTEPLQGAITIQISNAAPSSTVYTLLTTQIVSPEGAGPFFGLNADAFIVFSALYPLPPLVATTNPSGTYVFSAPVGTLPSGFPLQARSLQPAGPVFALSNIQTHIW